jgi:hypothetical protein
MVGPIGFYRLHGCLFTTAAIWCGFARELPVRMGNVEVGRLRGWHKAWAVVPGVLLGVALVVYAPGITCSQAKYKHLCK